MAKLTDFLKDKNGRQKAIVFMGICAMLLILISSCAEKNSASPASEVTSGFDSAEYTELLEKRLEEIISGIDGAGKTRVMITLSTERRLIYALEESSSVDSSESSDKSSGSEEKESSVILIKTGSGEQPLVVTSVAPQINGVLVVCEGGDNEQVKSAIEDAVTTVLGISSRHVCITKLSKSEQEEK